MLVNEIPEEYAYLAHHGIKGQRWGVRRYQNADGTLTKLGRRRLGIDKSRRQIRKEAKEKRKQAEAAQKAADAKAKLHEAMVKDPNKLYKYRNALSKEEIDSVMRDIEFNRKVKEIKKKDVDSALTTMQQVADFSKKTSDILNNAKSIYNIYAEAYNVFNKKGKQLTKIGEKKDDDRSAWELLSRTGNKATILANTKNFTPKELENAMKRLKYEESLVKDLTPAPEPETKPKDFKYLEKIDKGGETYYIYDRGLFNRTKSAVTGKKVKDIVDFNVRLDRATQAKKLAKTYTDDDYRKEQTILAAIADMKYDPTRDEYYV